jgi:hypothetical protein
MIGVRRDEVGEEQKFWGLLQRDTSICLSVERRMGERFPRLSSLLIFQQLCQPVSKPVSEKASETHVLVPRFSVRTEEAC